MANENEFEVFVFSIGEQEMAFDVDYVSMVIEKPEITPVPKSKKTVLGVMNLRGRIVPVVSLNLLLDIESSDDLEEKVVVVNCEDVEAGFIVNKVKGVLTCKVTEVEKLQKLEKFGEKSKGIIKKGEELIVYLNLEKTLGELMAASEYSNEGVW
ncbi:MULTISPECIES: chemotaxis protein CheW [Pseudothermotoga]|jgi:purine-binding chemotaxis protein CheW|uniref:Putative CheW protein n=2 Tax=Pseudothermotoga TaxID=1643951 RepID=A8F4W2_PSELT|nr:MULTISPECIES: chemotaxis protein CheW [Pseudothermotoga]ABV33196.1 putative CheW protein [Pseudothermotoga lettingae TMO]MDI3495900.1 purine-binding chemotaxis protein CheW [Pseudothermotoga sp.]MDK2884201.1 purine-binding chemotaxis protein CheW [Pseudothermotoga sp.]GLI49887.1 chemotaxis protein CheW [Pseudothermotoga lettingae TMO]HBJ81606.1 chemotaxis protein CheW [Pseudothermotoga sp.]